MIKKISLSRSIQIYLAIVAVLVTGYIYLSLMTPNDPATLQRYNISSVQITLVKLSLVIPFLIYWLSGIFSAILLKKYSDNLGAGVIEGKAISKIGKGVFVLVLGLISGAFLGSLRSYLLVGSPMQVNLFSKTFLAEDVTRFFTITTNYLNILFPLVAFWFIWKGSQVLVGSLNDMSGRTKALLLSSFALLIIVVSYAILVFANPYRQVGNPPLIKPTYYISDLMVFTTIIVPYLVYWFLGIFSLVNMTFYSERVSGIIYKKFFGNIVIGLLLIVALSIGLQFLSTIGYTFAQSSFNFILLLVYVIVFVQALGYVFIARGAGKLKSIEDVSQQ